MVLGVSQTARYKRYGKHDAYFYTKVHVFYNKIGEIKTYNYFTISWLEISVNHFDRSLHM